MSVTETPAPDVLDTDAAGGKAIRGGAMRMAAYVVQLGVSLAAVPIMVRHLGVADYGKYVTVSAIVFIIGGVTEAGLTNLGLRQYAQLDGHAREHHLKALAGLRFALSGAGVTLAVLFVWMTGAEDVIVTGTAIAGFGLLLGLTQQTYAIPLSGQLRLGWVTAIELIRQTMITGTIILLVVVGASLVPFFWANVTSAAVVLVVTLVLIGRETSARPVIDLPVWKATLREVLPYALAAAVGLVYFRIAVVLMSYIASETEAGIYGTAFRIVEVLGVFPWIAVSSGFPILARAARDDQARLRYALQRLFEVATIVGGGLALAIGLGAPFAIEVVGGAGFEDAVPVLRLLGLALVTSFLVVTWSFALLSLKAHRQLLIANALAAVITVIGVLALEPSLGAEGAAIATIVGEASLAAAYLFFLRRADAALMPQFGVAAKVALAAGAGALAGLLPLHSVVLAIVGTAVYAAVVLATRAVPAELVGALLRRS